MADCPLAHNAHSELWARHALTRRRNRGDNDWTMQWCDQCEAWHLWNPTTEEVG